MGRRGSELGMGRKSRSELMLWCIIPPHPIGAVVRSWNCLTAHADVRERKMLDSLSHTSILPLLCISRSNAL